MQLVPRNDLQLLVPTVMVSGKKLQEQNADTVFTWLNAAATITLVSKIGAATIQN